MHEPHARLGTLSGLMGEIEAWIIFTLLVVMLGLSLWAVAHLVLQAGIGRRDRSRQPHPSLVDRP